MRVDIHSWPRWVLDALHIDPDRIPRDAEALVTLRRFPESGWGLLAVLAVAAGCFWVGWVYRRELSLSRARKVIFASLRCLVVLALALAIFAPVLEVNVEHRQRAVTLVFLDDSLSFGIADAYASEPDLRRAVALATGVPETGLKALSRADIANRLLADPAARLLERLAEKNLLRLYTFSDGARRIGAVEGGADESGAATTTPDAGGGDAATAPSPPPAPPAPPAPALRPRGAMTDLGLAVRSVVESMGGVPVAAIVLVTDGRITAGEDPASLGLFLAERKIPVHAIGIGDPAPTRNLRVTALFAPERVFLGDPLAVDVRLDQRGFAGETVTVELLDVEALAPNGGGETAPRLAGSAQVAFDDAAEATARFEIELERTGAHRLIARVAPRDDETFDTDNERSLRVDVVEQATRALLIAGAPSNEFRILRTQLRRDRRVELAAWLMSADADLPQEGNVVLQKLPSTRKELFAYDVVILIDPAPEGFPAGFFANLDEFVGKHRGGLAYVAGEKHAARLFRDPAARPLLDLLAVEPDQNAIQDELGRGRFYLRDWPALPTSLALGEAATRLSTQPDRNRERWAELPGIFWSLPVRRAKPAATVLLEHPDPRLAIQGARRPLLATQFYEGGRSLFLGFDDTWRWRAISEDVYDQFWMQLVRSLTEGRLLGDRRQIVLTDRDTYGLGDVIRISALVRDEDYRPSAAPSLDVEILAADGSTTTLALQKDPTQAGWFGGVHMPSSIGRHVVRCRAGTGPGAEKVVDVEVPDLEYQDPRLDRVTLEDLSRATEGTLVPIEEFASLPDRIPDRSQRVVKSDEPRPLWDSALTLAVVVALLAIEWILRKWSRLP